ncbi:substrate-binding periplasmic protein [Roseateles sp. DC23W]|uniref:Substrate-binding periplasmic protein n=1 Tax=Pelomonas dachongensis TaxID=3299029 RepID=A0ABW7EGE1_9BURK
MDLLAEAHILPIVFRRQDLLLAPAPPRRRLAALALAAALAAGPAAADGTVRACAHPAAQPMSWQHQGRLHGVCIEAAKRAFAAAGWTLRVDDVGPWSRCQAMVERGQVDALVCAFDTPKRREYAVVVEPALARNEAALFVRRDSPLRFERWADLGGLRIGVGHGVSLGAEVDRQLARHAMVDNALSEAMNLRKLLAGRLDAVATAREAGEQMLRAQGCEQQVRVLPRTLGGAPLYLQISRQSPAIAALPAVRAYLQRPDYAVELQQLHGQQAELFRSQNPPPPQASCAP